MNKKWIGIGLGTVVLVGVVLLATRSEKKPNLVQKDSVKAESVAESPPPITNPQPPTTTSKAASPALKTAAIATSTNKQQTSSTEWSPEVAAQIDALRATYRPGGLPARIRLQDQINKSFSANPPSAEQMLGLIKDVDAPDESRIYFAKVLRNQIKRRAYDEAELADAVSGLQEVVNSTAQSELFRSELAMLLTTVDQSDQTIQAVLPLMDSSDDETATRAVAALCNTTSPLAIESLYDFVQDYANLEQSKPKALATALAPLSTVNEYDIVPVIQEVVSLTDDFDLMCTSLQCLMRVSPSQAALKAIVTTYDSANKIPEQTAYIQYLCRTALEQRSEFIQINETTLDQSLIEAIHDIRRKQ